MADARVTCITKPDRDSAHDHITQRFAAILATWPESRRRERERHFRSLRAYRQVMVGNRLGAARDFARAFWADPSARGIALLGASAIACVSPRLLLTGQGWVKQRWRGSDRVHD